MCLGHDDNTIVSRKDFSFTQLVKPTLRFQKLSQWILLAFFLIFEAKLERSDFLNANCRFG